MFGCRGFQGVEKVYIRLTRVAEKFGRVSFSCKVLQGLERVL